MRRSFLVAFIYVLGLPGALAQGLAMYDIAGGDFEQKVIAESANQPIVVMFRSNACAPCNMMTIEAPQMAFAAFAGKVKFYTVNIDTERALADKYRVTDLPGILVFKNGASVASSVGVVEKSPLFQFFAAQASPEAKQAYQTPPRAFEAKRPPGAELKTIGGWEIDRDKDGVAFALRAFKYLSRLDTTEVGPWTVTGSAALSLRYDAKKEETIWDVGYEQEITRTARRNEESVLQASGAKVVVEHPGSHVIMQLDGEQVATLPDPLMLQARERDTNAAQPLSGQRRRFQFVVANPYLRSMRFGDMTPARFEKLFVDGKVVQFSIAVDHQKVILCEIALEDTQKALAYLAAERAYVWRKQNAGGSPR